MENKKEKKKKENKFKIYSIFLIIALISYLFYLYVELKHYTSFINFIPYLLGLILVLLFLMCFIILGIKSEGKHQVTVIIGSLFITAYSIFNSLNTLGIINLPTEEFIPNFYNKDISELKKWSIENNINILENYEHSDTILKDYVISQDVYYPTLTKDVHELKVNISLGPDLEKEIIIPNFIGLKYDDVIKYIQENHLTNVKFNFTETDDNIDIVIEQIGSGSRKRNDEIILTIATSKEKKETTIPDLREKDLIYAENYLKKLGFKVDIEYDFSDTILKDKVIDQNFINEIKNPLEDTIILTISKGKKTISPDISSMNSEQINKWAEENNIKVSYTEEYNDDIKLGDVITSSVKKDDILSSGDKIEITISKGNLKMPSIKDINEFTNWATTNKVDYEINYEASDTIKKDNIIKCSHNVGDAIKENDTVIVTISKGKTITIPNFIGMNKSDIEKKCANINLNCNFKSGGYQEKVAKNIAVSQSKKANTSVSEGTSLTISLSDGIIEKVTIPSFVGMKKSDIEKKCSTLHVTCKFSYASGYSNTEKDSCVSQSKTGSVNKGSVINITLSNGPAKTYTIIIDANQLSSGNPTKTKETLEKKLKSACPGVTFKFTFQKANSGIGYLAPTSQIKVGSNKLTQGKTYNVIINSN